MHLLFPSFPVCFSRCFHCWLINCLHFANHVARIVILWPSHFAALLSICCLAHLSPNEHNSFSSLLLLFRFTVTVAFTWRHARGLVLYAKAPAPAATTTTTMKRTCPQNRLALASYPRFAFSTLRCVHCALKCIAQHRLRGPNCAKNNYWALHAVAMT